MLTSTDAPKFYEFNVGGKIRTFSYAELVQPYLKGSGFQKRVEGEFSSEVSFVGVNPKFFDQWIDPYIRHGVLPTLRDLKKDHVRNHLIAVVNSIALHHFAEHIEKLYKREYEIKVSSKNLHLYDDFYIIICKDKMWEISQIIESLSVIFKYYNPKEKEELKLHSTKLYGFFEDTLTQKIWEKAEVWYDNQKLNRDDVSGSIGLDLDKPFVIKLWRPE